MIRARTVVSALALLAAPASVPALGQTLSFRGACFEGERVLVAAVGDLLFHEALQRRSLTPGGSYGQFWRGVGDVIRGADIAYANLEGPAAHGVAPGGYAVKDPGRRLDGRVYGTAPGTVVFNYHPSVAADIKAAGFSVVSTANNHAADRGPLGIDRTIDNLDAAGLAFTGTRKRGEARPWSVTTRAKGMTVAWIACSYSTNGMPDPHAQVLGCYEGQETILAEIRRVWDEPGVDAVIVTPHWGVEGSHRPLDSDRDWARTAIEAGATAVIGTHPHVLQPWEHHIAGDGREALIIYSTGNFVSNQAAPAQRTGLIALVSLVRGPTGKAEVAAAGFVLTSVDLAAGHRVGELEGDAASRAGQLAQALKIVPAGNRVQARAFKTLPERCDGPLIAMARPAQTGGAAVASLVVLDAPPPGPLPSLAWRDGVAADTPDGQSTDAGPALQAAGVDARDPVREQELPPRPVAADSQRIVWMALDGIAWAALASPIFAAPRSTSTPAPDQPGERRGPPSRPVLVLADTSEREPQARHGRSTRRGRG